MKTLYQIVSEYVADNQEFQFLKEISEMDKVDFKYIVNFTLDDYNYQRKIGLDKTGAKIMSLTHAYDLCERCYERERKTRRN